MELEHALSMLSTYRKRARAAEQELRILKNELKRWRAKEGFIKPFAANPELSELTVTHTRICKLEDGINLLRKLGSRIS